MNNLPEQEVVSSWKAPKKVVERISFICSRCCKHTSRRKYRRRALCEKCIIETYDGRQSGD